MTILGDILVTKRTEVEAAKLRVPPEVMAERADAIVTPARGFRRALVEGEAPAIIAEIKRRSPSKGEIRPNFDPEECALAYQSGGAACLSILTDEKFFGGRLEYLAQVRECVDLPILRKDFTIDAYQIDEARVAGADAVLLIVAAMPRERLEALHRYAVRRGLDVLVEVHDLKELEVALSIRADLIGVNNRNLRTFETRLEVTEEVAARAPLGENLVLVAESGIATPEDVNRLQMAGATAFLVGESLMREPDVGLALRELRGSP